MKDPLAPPPLYRRTLDIRLLIPATGMWGGCFLATGPLCAHPGHYRWILPVVLAAISLCSTVAAEKYLPPLFNKYMPDAVRPWRVVAAGCALALLAVVCGLVTGRHWANVTFAQRTQLREVTQYLSHGPGGGEPLWFSAKVNALPSSRDENLSIDLTLISISTTDPDLPNSVSGIPVKVGASVIAPGQLSDYPVGATIAFPGTLLSPPIRSADPTRWSAPRILAFDTPHVTGQLGYFAQLAHRMRMSVLQLSDTLAGDQRGLVPGVALGYRDRMPADLTQDMRAASMTHMTAVSGAHLAIVISLVLALVAPLRPRYLAAAFAGGGLWSFITLVGPHASVRRAGACAVALIIAMGIGRPRQSFAALMGGNLVLLAFDPSLARSWGWCLSMSATCAIIFLSPPYMRWLARLVPRPLATAIAVPAAAQTVVAPMIVLLNPTVGLWAIPANVIGSLALAPATIFGVASTVLGVIWPAGGRICAALAGLACEWIARVAHVFASLPGAALTWHRDAIGIIALVAMSCAGLALAYAMGGLISKYRSGVLRVLAGASVIILIAIVAYRPLVIGSARGGDSAPFDENWAIIQCDVGQGAATLIRTAPHTVILFDTGKPTGKVITCLRRAEVSVLAAVVISHEHQDHVGDIPAVLAAVEVEQIISTRGPAPPQMREMFSRAAGQAGLEIRRVDRSVDLPNFPIAARAIAPPASIGDLREEERANDGSIMLVVPLAGADFIITADATEWSQRQALGALKTGEWACWGPIAPSACKKEPIDRTKVVIAMMPHHGSADQNPDFARYLDPDVVILPVGDNDYGHPTSRALALYEGADIYRTDECGSLVFDERGRALSPCGVQSKDPHSVPSGLDSWHASRRGSTFELWQNSLRERRYLGYRDPVPADDYQGGGDFAGSARHSTPDRASPRGRPLARGDPH